jgi:hypothetical protein
LATRHKVGAQDFFKKLPSDAFAGEDSGGAADHVDVGELDRESGRVGGAHPGRARIPKLQVKNQGITFLNKVVRARGANPESFDFVYFLIPLLYC